MIVPFGYSPHFPTGLRGYLLEDTRVFPVVLAYGNVMGSLPLNGMGLKVQNGHRCPGA